MLRRDMRLGPAFDFVTFEALVQLGCKLSVRSLQLLAAAGYVLAIPVTAAASIGLAALGRAGLQNGPPDLAARAWIVVAALALLNLYLAAMYWFRETFSKRRFAVGGSPNAALLRAVDVPALGLFAAACAVRILAVFSLATVATLGVVVVFLDVLEPALAAALVLLPVAAGVGLLALSAHFAVTNTSARPRVRGRYVLATVPLLASSGWLVAQVAAAAGAGTAGKAGARSILIGPQAALAALAVVALALVLCALALRVAIRELRRRSFEIEQTRTCARAQSAPAARTLAGVLHRELRSARSYFLLQKSALLLALGVAFLAGMRLSGNGLLPIDANPDLWLRAGLVLTYICSLTAAEVVLNACGPLTLRGQLRYAWDCGAQVTRMLPGAVAYWLAPVGLIATATTVSLYLLLGQIIMSPFAVSAATAAAALLAGAVSAVPRSHSDGSSDTSLFVALLTVILSAPVLVAALAGDAMLTAAGQLYVLVLIGGAGVWTAKRIRFLPSCSPT